MERWGLLLCAIAVVAVATATPQTVPKPTCPTNQYGVVCSDAGSCIDGTCICVKGYTKPDCSENTLIGCPNLCFGHGTCNNGTCECDVGFTGESCGESTGCESKAFCSSHGTCNGDVCVCDAGWEGVDCSEAMSCPDNCNGNGICTLHTPPASHSTNTSLHSRSVMRCVCNPHFTGPSCGSLAGSMQCPNACSGHGRCDAATGACECHPGFHGPSCSAVRPLCAMSCGHGRCAGSPPHCECDPQYTGPQCNIPVRSADNPASCVSDAFCSGHGTCSPEGECQCQNGFTGRTCGRTSATPACPQGCSSHGICRYASDKAAVCSCLGPWEGPDCSSPRCDTDAEGRVCAHNGVCQRVGNTTVYRCVCDEGYQGDDCSSVSPSCLNDCSGHGTCIDGVCSCDPSFTGNACDVPSDISAGGGKECCPYDCSDNGTCDMIGCKCVCNTDWEGDACNVFSAGDEMA